MRLSKSSPPSIIRGYGDKLSKNFRRDNEEISESDNLTTGGPGVEPLLGHGLRIKQYQHGGARRDSAKCDKHQCGGNLQLKCAGNDQRKWECRPATSPDRGETRLRRLL